MAIVPAFIIGASHFTSWDFEFLNSGGQALWRGCTICLLVTASVFTVFSAFGYEPKKPRLFTFFAFWTVLVNGVSRFILLYLLVYSFYSMPTGVYETKNIEWLKLIPFVH